VAQWPGLSRAFNNRYELAEFCVRAFGGAKNQKMHLKMKGVRLKSEDVRRDIAVLWKSFRTYTGDG
jgi:hypothetical protein